MKRLLISAGLILAAAPAHAGWHHCRGTYEEERAVSQTTKPTDDCRETQALALGRVTHAYPALGGAELEVDAWLGAFGYPVHMRNVFAVDVYSCRGELQNTYERDEESDAISIFPVDNPNLHDDVGTSFAANAPLTDTEAASAFAAARATCEAARKDAP
jgi:hypothetical protein